MSESFQVAALIEKLTPLGRDFNNYFKHNRKEWGLKTSLSDYKLKNITVSQNGELATRWTQGLMW